MDPQNIFLSDSEEEDLALSGLRFACLLVNARLHRSERRTTILSTSRNRHAAVLARFRIDLSCRARNYHLMSYR